MTLPAVPQDRRGASLPPLFVSSMFFPGKPPGLLGGGGEASSGPGWQIVFYWVLSSATVKALRGPEVDWPPHLQLWKRYVRDADRDLGFNGAMKGVAQADNMKDLPLPRFIKGYNGKPVRARAGFSIFASRATPPRFDRRDPPSPPRAADRSSWPSQRWSENARAWSSLCARANTS